jgi:hypothetical protein
MVCDLHGMQIRNRLELRFAMHRMLLGSAAALALLAGPAMAADLYTPPPAPPPSLPGTAPIISGDLELGAGIFHESYYDDSYSSGIVTGVGRAAVPLSGGLSLEGEVTGRSVFDDGESYYSGFAAVGHVYMSGLNYAAGLFGGYTSIDDYSGYVIGGEANYYTGPATLFAQLAYWNGSDYYDGVLQGRIGGHYYFTPDTRGTLDVSYFSNDIDDVWSAEGRLEHRFTGTNWSAFASAGYYADSENSSDWNVWTAKVGFRLLIDPPGTTLQAHDKAVPFNVTLPLFVPNDR